MTNQVAINQKDVTSQILSRIDEMQGEGLALPKNYNPSNALQIAFLKIQEMKVRNQPVLEIVTKKSVVESLLNMTLQGLSPAKNQCYFIPYGDQLQMQRSYFGTQAALKRLDGVNDIWAEVIRRDETFEFENDAGRKRLVKHEQTFETLDNEIIGAYAVIDTKGEGQLLEIMTRKQIDASWSQAKSSNVHNKFGDQMAMRTVINRAAKNYINTSDDSDLLVHAINDTTENEFDEEKRARDVTEAPQEEKAQILLSEFKTNKKDEVVYKNQAGEVISADEIVPMTEKEVNKEQGFSQNQIDELNAMSQEKHGNEMPEESPFGVVEPNEYAEFEEVVEATEIDFKELTMDQIKEMLDKENVKYNASAKRDEIVAVAEMALNGGGLQDELF